MSDGKKSERAERLKEGAATGGWLALAGLAALAFPLKVVVQARDWAAERLEGSFPLAARLLGGKSRLGQRYALACRDGRLSEAQELRLRHGLARFDLEALEKASLSKEIACAAWVADQASPRAKNRFGLTPLMIAAEQWGSSALDGGVEFDPIELEALARLIERSAEAGVLDAKERSGKTALALLAARVRELSILRLFHKAGADFFSVDHAGERAIDGIFDGGLRLEALSWVESDALRDELSTAGLKGASPRRSL